MKPDLTVIRRQGRYCVLSHSQPVRLRDGTTLDLHLVQEHNQAPARFLRAVLDHPLIESHIVDVRDLASCLDAEIRQLPERDSGDLVVLTLRQFYPDGAGLLCRIVEESLAKLPTEQGAAEPAARRQGLTQRQRRFAAEATHAAA